MVSAGHTPRPDTADSSTSARRTTVTPRTSSHRACHGYAVTREVVASSVSASLDRAKDPSSRECTCTERGLSPKPCVKLVRETVCGRCNWCATPFGPQVERTGWAWPTRRRPGRGFCPGALGGVRPKKLPERLICDSVTSYVTPKHRMFQTSPSAGLTKTGKKKRKRAARVAFSFCAVVGTHSPAHRSEVMALVVVRTADQVTWADILRALPPGRPVSVLSDEDNSLFNAVDEV